MDPHRAGIFGQYAEAYARWRPAYPADAVTWLVPPGASRVVDVGAGTGKLTGLLLERGLSVEAVEPDPRMLHVLSGLHPTAVAHQAGAETLPLPDASMDAVLAADAWHWFPHEQAVREVRRVLRPDGWLGLVWNIVAAPTQPWEYELAELDPDHNLVREREPLVPGLFHEPTETATFPWTRKVTPDQWRSSMGTHSAIAMMELAERETRLDASRAVLATVCEATGRTTASVRYDAVCVRWRPS